MGERTTATGLAVEPPDVFLSYNSRDEAVVTEIAERLKGRGLRIWLDAWDLMPGQPFQPAIEQALVDCRAVAVFVGRHGLGRWEEPEMRAAIAIHVERKSPVIPVLLAGGAAPEQWPPFLRAFTAVTCTADISDEVLDKLQWGITGIKPAKPKSRSGSARRSLAPSSSKLNQAIAARDRLRALGEDTAERDLEILTLKRELRAGGRVGKGDVLHLDGVARFVLLDRLGKGGFATVWRALDQQLGQQVAIKLLHGNLADERSRLERFFRGAREMARLDHPGIVQVSVPHAEDDGFHYFVMELIEGGDLHHAVIEKRIDSSAIVPLILRLGDALAAAHRAGLIHRDVKPANVLLAANGHPKLTDFDLVAGAHTTGGTRTGAMGTVVYAAPELLHKPQDADARADVYGLAMTMLFALRGQALPMTVLRSADSEIDALDCNPAVKRLLAKALDWDVNARPASVEAYCAALRMAAHVDATPTKSPRGRPRHSIAEPTDDTWPPKEKRASHRSSAVPSIKQQLDSRSGPFTDDTQVTARAPASSARRSAVPIEQGKTRADQHRTSPRQAARPAFNAPEWALGSGEDEYGHWATFAVKGAAQRMRLILPGTFMMGSPDNEEGRSDNEGPQHAVRISKAFWLGDTPCTQALWSAVMGQNPSHTEGDRLPVETVSFEAVQAFLRKLASFNPQLMCRLPSEAEWEYACRAGSQNERYSLRGATGAADVTTIAWYVGNSSRRTQPVAGKAPNAWGLYDMLGNVLEWCADGPRRYETVASPLVDPLGNTTSDANRVVRGGSWCNHAQNVRAAFRYAYLPTLAYDILGFRVARGQDR